ITSREVTSILRSGRRNPWKEDTVADDVMNEYAGVEDGPELIASARNFGAALVERLRAQLSTKGVELFELLFVHERDVTDVAGARARIAAAAFPARLPARRARKGNVIAIGASVALAAAAGLALVAGAVRGVGPDAPLPAYEVAIAGPPSPLRGAPGPGGVDP